MPESDLSSEIAELERRLQDARASQDSTQRGCSGTPDRSHVSSKDVQHDFTITPATHNILLLGDSALPLGSFAFSSGLESFLAHRPRSKASRELEDFNRFLHLSLGSLASTALPFVIAAHQGHIPLTDLDNDLDASTTCCVAKRASIAQGNGLITLWDKSFKAQSNSSTATGMNEASVRATADLGHFVQALKTPRHQAEASLELHGHLAPLFGVLCAAMSVALDQALYLFLLNHAKTLLSAAIRASVMGPYHAQSILAGAWLMDRIREMVERETSTPRAIEDVGQTVPALDLWGGRHEIIYSRIFNS